MNYKLEHDYEAWLKEKMKNFTGEHTSDDTFTPAPVYEYLIDWIFEHTRKADGLEICRPFYPGGDYEHEDYTGKVVIDNPPFSILSKIVAFYEERKIPYFLFAPSLTALACYRGRATNYIYPKNHDVIYANGVNVKTAFISNLFEHHIMIMADMNLPVTKKKKKHNSVEYPDGIYNSARLSCQAYNATENKYYDNTEYTTVLPDGHRVFGGAVITNEYKGQSYSTKDT